MARLHDLVVEQHSLELDFKLTFLAPEERLTEATIRTIQSELDEHLAKALASRDMTVLRIDRDHVKIARSANGKRRE